MKLCQTCGQMLAEEITTCPSSGREVVEGRKSIVDYWILDVLHEGYASILCRALKEGAGEPVMLRIFTPRSGIDETIAGRLKEGLEELKKLPEDYFVQHYEIRKSFKRLPGLTGSQDLEDRYAVEGAYSTGGNRRLTLSGVGKAPEKTWQHIKAPLRDDLAVLKIDPVPVGLRPLPLDHGMDPFKVPKLLPVITLGFPLGSRTQEMAINVVTMGHVRRAFENFLQVDTSLYRGNSGGPLPVATPLSDLGMVLPITGAAADLLEIKAGRVKWNGVLDLSVETKIEQITQLAGNRQWKEAREMADKELQTSLNPSLIMAAVMPHLFCGDRPEAAFLFDQADSMDADNGSARLMLYIIDWLNGRSDQNRYRREFLSFDWRSSHEFYAHLVRILEGLVAEESSLAGGYSAGEKSWLHYVVGLRRLGRSPLVENERLFKDAVYLADGAQWIFYLSLSELDRLQKKRLAQLQTPTERNAYQAEIQATDHEIQIRIKDGGEKHGHRTVLYTRLKEPTIDAHERRDVLDQLLDVDPSDSEMNDGPPPLSRPARIKMGF